MNLKRAKELVARFEKETNPDLNRVRRLRKRFERVIPILRERERKDQERIDDMTEQLKRVIAVDERETKRRKEHFGRRFNFFLQRNGLSVEEYCKLTGIAPNTIYRRQRGVFGPTGEIEILMDLLEKMEKSGENIRRLLKTLVRERLPLAS